MTIHWLEAKEDLEDEIDKITWDEPLEVKMSRLGVFPGGCGARNQYFGNLVSNSTALRAISGTLVGAAMQRAISDPLFSLEACKRLWVYLTMPTLHLLGGSEKPGLSHAWGNLGTALSFGEKVEQSLASVESKEELEDLFWSWFNYIGRLFRWLFSIIPWELSENDFELASAERIAELVKSGELPAEAVRI